MGGRASGRGGAARPGAPLNARTYTSPSGDWALDVNRTARDGTGPAAYRVARKGAVVWSATHPFTLHEAAVTDEGVVGSYGYEYGVEGFGGPGRGPGRGPGKFQVAVFAPDGALRANVAVEREDSRFIHDVPNPLATGLFVDAAQKRLVVRVRKPDINAGGETWWVYDQASALAVGGSRNGWENISRIESTVT